MVWLTLVNTCSVSPEGLASWAVGCRGARSQSLHYWVPQMPGSGHRGKCGQQTHRWQVLPLRITCGWSPGTGGRVHMRSREQVELDLSWDILRPLYKKAWNDSGEYFDSMQKRSQQGSQQSLKSIPLYPYFDFEWPPHGKKHAIIQ